MPAGIPLKNLWDHCADCGVAGVDGSVPGVDSGAVGETGSACAEGVAVGFRNFLHGSWHQDHDGRDVQKTTPLPISSSYLSNSPMKERKGQNSVIWRLFVGFGYVSTGIRADRLNLLVRWTGVSVRRFSNHAPMRDLTFVASVTEWRSAPGFPFSFKSAAQSCRGSLAFNQDNRDIVDAPSVVLVSRGS